MEDLNDKITGDNLTAAEFVQPMSEIQNVIENLGQTLTSSDLNQLGKGIAGYVANGTFYTDNGSANAYVLTTIGLKQTATSYTEDMQVIFIAATTNTGSSTVNVAGLGVKNITDTSGGGEIVAGIRYELNYRTSTGEFETLSSATKKEVKSITATVSASALTLGLKADTMEFRSSSLTSGIAISRAFSDLSLVVPSTATLGTIDGVQSKLILVAIDNAGAVELAVINQTGGNNLDESGLISTVIMSAASTSDNVFYSATARNNVAYRVVGFVESTQATAGTWDTAPSKLQGAGGKALKTLTSRFISAEQTITSAGSLTIAHGLGAVPELAQIRVICKTAEYGFSVDDDVVINPAGNDPGGTTSRGIVVRLNSTNILLKYASAATPITLFRADTGVAVSLTNANWRVIVRAWS